MLPHILMTFFVLNFLRRFWIGSDVQRRVRARKPSFSCGFQTFTKRRVWHIPEHQQKTKANSEKNGYWHGKTMFRYYFFIVYAYNITIVINVVFRALSYSHIGTFHWHVQTYEPVGWPQNYGGNKKSGRFRGIIAGQLHRQNTSKLDDCSNIRYEYVKYQNILYVRFPNRSCKTWYIALTWVTPPNRWNYTNDGSTCWWRNSSSRVTKSENKTWTSVRCATDTVLRSKNHR